MYLHHTACSYPRHTFLIKRLTTNCILAEDNIIHTYVIAFLPTLECKYYAITGQKFVQEDTRPHYSRSGDVIHPQLRCGSGYETTADGL